MSKQDFYSDNTFFFVTVTQAADEETKTICPSDGSPNLVLDCPAATLYLRFPHERELKVITN